MGEKIFEDLKTGSVVYFFKLSQLKHIQKQDSSMKMSVYRTKHAS